MQKLVGITLSAALMLIMTACGGGAKDKKGELGDKKAKLEKLKKEQTSLSKQITDLEKEIATLDPASAATKPKLVSLATIGTDTFSHFIDLQGRIEAENISYVAPRGGSGVVRAIYVKQGQNVRKGQTLLKLDDAIYRQQVVTAEQQIGGIRAQLTQAQSIYERQQNLWKQNIGTEIQVLNAKTNVETLKSQLSAAQQNVKLAQEQLNTTVVQADINGVVEKLDIKEGEMFMGGGSVTIVNNADLKVKVQVPENYLGRVQTGSVLNVTLPEAGNKTITTKVSVAGSLIDPSTRSFYIEGKIPTNKDFRPNQIAMVKIKDYTAANAITVPVNTVQNDEKGKYVMVAVKEGNKQLARKHQVTLGELYGNQLEIRSGLKAGDVIITEGFQNLYDGQLITTEVK